MTTPIITYTNQELDRAYNQTAGQMLRQIRAMSTAQGSQIQAALVELEEEADRLEAESQRMDTDSASLLKTLAAIAALFAAASALIMANDNDIEASGASIAVPAVTAKVFGGLASLAVRDGKNPASPALLPIYADALKSLGVTWNLPAVTDFARKYTGSTAWAAKMDKWGPGYAKLIGDTVQDGLQSGWGPRFTADHIRKLAENLPQHAAENLTRTLQLTAYRDASAAMDLVNGDYIEHKLRVATLDDKTCLSCIDQHGTRLEKGERVDDHYRGRCTEFYVVKGGPRQPETMQADSKPGQRNFVPFQSGRDWFASLSPARQAQQASFVKVPAKLEAYRAGVPLSDFVGTHNDDIFGRQLIERSLIGALGDDAKQYYLRGHNDD
jgi:hypothetical protein